MNRGHIVDDGPSETLRNDLAKLEQIIGIVRASAVSAVLGRCPLARMSVRHCVPRAPQA
jgi:hypothetical protein